MPFKHHSGTYYPQKLEEWAEQHHIPSKLEVLQLYFDEEADCASYDYDFEKYKEDMLPSFSKEYDYITNAVKTSKMLFRGLYVWNIGDIRKNHPGKYWSLDERQAEEFFEIDDDDDNYMEGDPYEVMLTIKMPSSEKIDWGTTYYLMLKEFSTEQEIRLYDDSNLEYIAIDIYHNGERINETYDMTEATSKRRSEIFQHSSTNYPKELLAKLPAGEIPSIDTMVDIFYEWHPSLSAERIADIKKKYSICYNKIVDVINVKQSIYRSVMFKNMSDLDIYYPGYSWTIDFDEALALDFMGDSSAKNQCIFVTKCPDISNINIGMTFYCPFIYSSELEIRVLDDTKLEVEKALMYDDGNYHDILPDIEATYAEASDAEQMAQSENLGEASMRRDDIIQHSSTHKKFTWPHEELDKIQGRIPSIEEMAAIFDKCGTKEQKSCMPPECIDHIYKRYYNELVDILKDKSTKLYRTVGVDSYNEVDYYHPGYSWSYDKRRSAGFTFYMSGKKMQILYEAELPALEDIDIGLTFYLPFVYGSEREIRLRNDENIKITQIMGRGRASDNAPWEDVTEEVKATYMDESMELEEAKTLLKENGIQIVEDTDPWDEADLQPGLHWATRRKWTNDHNKRIGIAPIPFRKLSFDGKTKMKEIKDAKQKIDVAIKVDKYGRVYDETGTAIVNPKSGKKAEIKYAHNGQHTDYVIPDMVVDNKAAKKMPTLNQYVAIHAARYYDTNNVKEIARKAERLKHDSDEMNDIKREYNQMAKGLKSKYMYRRVDANDIENLDLNYPGFSWCYDEKYASNYGEFAVGYKSYLLKAINDKDNIDYWYSALLAQEFNEHEIRVKDDYKVRIISVKEYERGNYEETQVDVTKKASAIAQKDVKKKAGSKSKKKKGTKTEFDM